MLIQVAILILFFFASSINNFVDIGALQKSDVIIDKAEYKHLFMTGNTFCFYSGEDKYVFPKIPVFGTNEYSMADLYKNIKDGDLVTIYYVDTDDNRTVYEIVKNEIRYRSVNGYNNYVKAQQIYSTVAFIFAELLFLASLIFFILFHKKELKRCLIRSIHSKTKH